MSTPSFIGWLFLIALALFVGAVIGVTYGEKYEPPPATYRDYCGVTIHCVPDMGIDKAQIAERAAKLGYRRFAIGEKVYYIQEVSVESFYPTAERLYHEQ